MSQGSGLAIPPTWLLLDNQSTVDVFANDDMLEDIHEVDDEMAIASNGGTSATQCDLGNGDTARIRTGMV
jgi:hypothetical protein